MNEIAKIDHDLPDFGISAQQLDASLLKAGFVDLSVDAFIGIGSVGEAIKQMGAVKIGRSRLLLSDEQIARAFAYCEKLLLNQCDKPDALALNVNQQITLINVMGTLATARIKAAGRMIDSAKIDLSDSAKMPGSIPSFLPKGKSMPVITADVIVDAKAPNEQQATDGRS